MRISQHVVGAAVFTLFGVFAAGYWLGQQGLRKEADDPAGKRTPAAIHGVTVQTHVSRYGVVTRIDDRERDRTCYAVTNGEGGAAIDCR